IRKDTVERVELYFVAHSALLQPHAANIGTAIAMAKANAIIDANQGKAPGGLMSCGVDLRVCPRCMSATAFLYASPVAWQTPGQTRRSAPTQEITRGLIGGGGMLYEREAPLFA